MNPLNRKHNRSKRLPSAKGQCSPKDMGNACSLEGVQTVRFACCFLVLLSALWGCRDSASPDAGIDGALPDVEQALEGDIPDADERDVEEADADEADIDGGIGDAPSDSDQGDANPRACSESSIITDSFAINDADFAVEDAVVHVVFNTGLNGTVLYRKRDAQEWSDPELVGAPGVGWVSIALVDGTPWVATTDSRGSTTIHQREAGTWSAVHTVAGQTSAFTVDTESTVGTDSVFRFAVLLRLSAGLSLKTFVEGTGEQSPQLVGGVFEEANLHFGRDGLLGVVWSTSTGAVGGYRDGPHTSPGAGGPIALPDGSTTGALAVNVDSAPEFLLSGDDGWNHVSGTDRVAFPSSSIGSGQPKLLRNEQGEYYAMVFALGPVTTLWAGRSGDWSELHAVHGQGTALRTLAGGGVAATVATGSSGSENLIFVVCE